MTVSIRVKIGVKACFDWISHDWLLSNITMDIKMLRQWLKCGYFQNDRLFPTSAGTPQGGLCKALHNPPYAKKVIMQSNLPKY